MNIWNHHLIKVIFYLLITTSTSGAFAKTVRSLVHQKIAPTLDGILNEAEWQKATKIEVDYESSPAKGAPAPVRALAYIYEDGKSLHIALHAFDPEPDKLTAHFTDRDNAWGDDLLGVVIDTFNDERGAYEFYVNPMGVQIDTRMKDNNYWDANVSWNAIWDSAVVITDDGWTAELSIPFKALRFANTDGEQTWGFAVFRAYQGEVEHWISDFIADENLSCNLCQFNKLKGFGAIKPGKNVQLAPTLTYSHSETRDTTTEQPWVSEDNTPEAGLSLRWAPTENSVINATVNPDFSQIEADAAQLDINNTYALFVPEKRPFFLDGADYFSSDAFNLVHTRNIVNPDAGLKLTGKNGRHSYGLTLANDNSTSYLLPGNQGSDIATLNTNIAQSNVAIARYKADIGKKSNLGVLITNRENEAYFNTLISIDGKAWLSQFDSIQYQAVKSKSENPLEIQHSFGLAPKQSGDAYALKYSRENKWYSIEANLSDVDSDFRADMGFIAEANYRRAELSGTVKLYGDTENKIKNSYYKMAIKNTQNKEGLDIENIGELSAVFEGIYHFRTEVKLSTINRFYKNAFNAEGETFEMRQGEVTTKFRPSAFLQLDLTAKAGDEIDYENAQMGYLLQLNLAMNFNFGKHLSVNLSQNYRSLKVESSDYTFNTGSIHFNSGKAFTANQSDLRISYQFNIQSQLKLVAQHTEISRDTHLYRANFDSNTNNDIAEKERSFSTQLIYSYKINSQSLLYLGYADSGFQDGSLVDLKGNHRSIFAKVSYAWQN